MERDNISLLAYFHPFSPRSRHAGDTGCAGDVERQQDRMVVAGGLQPYGGTYILAIQNSNDYVCSPNCNPQGTACRLCVTWSLPIEPSYRVYLPLILKVHSNRGYR